MEEKLRTADDLEEIKGKGAAEIVKKILQKEGMNQRQLADKMGCVRQNLSQKLNRGSSGMRYDSFQQMVKTLGYEVIVRKKHAK